MPASSSSSSSSSSPCTTPGRSIGAYYDRRHGKKHCQHCDRSFEMGTGVDALKYHMHSDHKQFAAKMGIDLPSILKKKALPPSQPSLFIPSSGSNSSHDLIVLDDNPPPPSPLILSSSSASSSSSSHSSSSQSSTAVLQPPSPMPPPPPRRPAKRLMQRSIKQWETTDLQRTAAAHDGQLDFWLEEGLPFLLADSPGLHEWMHLHHLGDGSILNRRQLVAGLQGRVDGIMKQVVSHLRACSGVTVGIDGWTNRRHEKVINLCPVGRGVAYYWNSVVLQGYANAEAQCGPISSNLSSIISKGVLVVAIVSDNESVNGALYRRLRSEYSFLIHVPCAAHTIQLCVRKVMEIPTVKRVVTALLELLAAFRASKDLRVNLKEQQALSRRGRLPLQLVTVCDTRWNSTLFAAERVLELESCIRPHITDIVRVVQNDDIHYCDALFWDPLKALVEFLQPFRVATDVVQSDIATLVDVHERFAALMVVADDLISPHPLAPIRTAVMECIRAEWNAHVNISVVIMCALFSFSPAYTAFPKDQLTAADTWFEEWATHFLLFYGLSDSDEEDAVRCVLQDQLSAFNQREGTFSDLDSARARRAKVAARENRLDDPRTMWGLKMRAAPELCACVLALLELTASEAAVERSFSRQGLIHSKSRNRLADDTIQLSMCYAFNSRALRHNRRQSQGWEELPDDYVPIDVVRGTSLLCFTSEDLECGDDEEEVGSRRRENVESSAERRQHLLEEEKGELYMRVEEVRTEEERIEAFIEEYVAKHHITRGYRFGGPREGTLQAALIAARLTMQVVDMKKRIKAYVATTDGSGVQQQAAEFEE
jgi:hypothetical protein